MKARVVKKVMRAEWTGALFGRRHRASTVLLAGDRDWRMASRLAPDDWGGTGGERWGRWDGTIMLQGSGD